MVVARLRSGRSRIAGFGGFPVRRDPGDHSHTRAHVSSTEPPQEALADNAEIAQDLVHALASAAVEIERLRNADDGCDEDEDRPFSDLHALDLNRKRRLDGSVIELVSELIHVRLDVPDQTIDELPRCPLTLVDDFHVELEDEDDSLATEE